MKIGEKITVSKDNEQSTFERLSSQALHLEKSFFEGCTGRDFLVTGEGWLLWNFLEVECELRVLHGGGTVQILPGMRLYTPSFAVVPYEKHSTGKYRVEAIGVYERDANPLGDESLCLMGAPGVLERQPHAALQKARSILVRQSLKANESSLARRTREAICSDHARNSPLEEIARSLKSSSSVVSRQFKNSYGLSPNLYRQKLKLAESIRLMFVFDKNVDEAARLVGYESRSQFNQAFRNAYHTAPSQYAVSEGPN